MKKILSLTLTVVLMLSVFSGMSSVALAAGDVSLSLDQSSVTASSGDTVNITATIVNGTSEQLTAYRVVYGSQTFGGDATLAPGDPGSVDVALSVSDDMLDKTITLQAQYKTATLTDWQNGGAANLTINRKALSVKIAASGKASPTLISSGDTVTFTFNIENQGEAELSNIVVTAPELNSGQPLNTAFSLTAGQSETVTYKYKASTAVTVKPSVSYSANGTAQTAYKIDPIELTLESRDVEPTLTVDNRTPNADEDVTFTLTIVNNGNVPYTNLSVMMNGEKMDFPSSKLNPDDTLSEEYTMSFQTSTDVKFTITLKDHKDQTKSVSTNTISITLPVDSDVLNQKLALVMDVDKPQLSAAGAVTFSGYVSNTSEYNLTDISVSEATLGTIFETSSMAAGAKEDIEWPADVNETTTYQFVLTAKDESGQTYTINADPITVTISGASVSADTSESADETETLTLETSEGSVGSLGIWAIIAIILVVLIVGVGVTLLVLWRKGKSPSKAAAAKSAAARRRTPPRNGPVRRPPAPKNYKDRNNF